MTEPPPPRATVAIVGPGGIGGVAAACLRHADRHDVVVCARRRLERLTLEWPAGEVTVALRCLTDPAAAAPVDWVLVCTKAQETAAIGPWLRRLCGPATRIATLQNGIDHADRVAPFAPAARVVPAIITYNGERLGPDRVRLRHTIGHDLTVADDAAGRAFAALFEATPLKFLFSPDLTTAQWRKLLVNVVANPITALTRQRQAVLRRPDMLALSRAVLEEAVAVGRAAGARLGPDEAADILATLLSYPEAAGTSMYFDTLAGRSLEVEALTGAIVAAGARHGIPTPLNLAFLTLLRAISDAAPAPAG